MYHKLKKHLDHLHEALRHVSTLVDQNKHHLDKATYGDEQDKENGLHDGTDGAEDGGNEEGSSEEEASESPEEAAAEGDLDTQDGSEDETSDHSMAVSKMTRMGMLPKRHKGGGMY